MLKKIREFFSQKGQGVVEYAILLGLAAAIAAALVGSTGLQSNANTAVSNAKAVGAAANSGYVAPTNITNSNS